MLRSHTETPTYVTGISKWLGLLEGHRYKQPLVGKGGVDALSGATVTAEAILRIVDRARARAAGELLGLAPRTSPSGKTPFFARLFTGPRAWIVLLFLGLLVLVYRVGGWKLRLVGLVLSVAILGFWLNVPFTAVDLAGLSYGNLPGVGEKAVLVFGVLILSVAFGQLWCGYGCPFGALQELLWLVLHPRGVDAGEGLGGARQISPALEQRARYLKFGVLALVLCFFWLSANPAYLALDPMTSAFTTRIPGHAIWLLVAIGVTALAYFRPFCRYLCPAGAFLALFNKVRLLDRFVRPRALSRCDLGVTQVEHLDCLKCNRCLVQLPPTDKAI